MHTLATAHVIVEGGAIDGDQRGDIASLRNAVGVLLGE